jgi:hypothetical protein
VLGTWAWPPPATCDRPTGDRARCEPRPDTRAFATRNDPARQTAQTTSSRSRPGIRWTCGRALRDGSTADGRGYDEARTRRGARQSLRSRKPPATGRWRNTRRRRGA